MPKCAFRSPARSGSIPRGPFSSFFRLLFSLEKSPPQKTSFFYIFLIFQVFQRRFFSIFSYSGDSLVVIFGNFSGLHVLIVFSTFFDKKTKSLKSENCLKPCKIRTIVKVATFKKKGEERRTHAEKNIDFGGKLGENRSKHRGKRSPL